MSTTPLQVLSISTALVASGGIATLSLFDVPLLQSQPASRSLPSIRWLFSRGSHVFPSAALVSSAGFAYLAYEALPATNFTLAALMEGVSGLYVVASVFSFSIAPWTSLVMIPTNFDLIQRNEEKGGARSEKSARERKPTGTSRTAEDSVDGKGDVSQFEDLSGPQEKTTEETSERENKEVGELLKKFRRLNAVRAVLMGVGGITGLIGALKR
jgi:hypothetical protein